VKGKRGRERGRKGSGGRERGERKGVLDLPLTYMVTLGKGMGSFPGRKLAGCFSRNEIAIGPRKNAFPGPRCGSRWAWLDLCAASMQLRVTHENVLLYPSINPLRYTSPARPVSMVLAFSYNFA